MIKRKKQMQKSENEKKKKIATDTKAKEILNDVTDAAAALPETTAKAD